MSDQGREKKVLLCEFTLCGLRLKAIQKCDFILCFRQELRKSAHAFVQNSVSAQLILEEIRVKCLKVVL